MGVRCRFGTDSARGLKMNTRILVMVSAVIEAAAGVTLMAVPNVAAWLLLGTGLTASGIVVARVAGFGFLALGLACWPGNDDANPQAIRALFVYNLLAALYLGYLGANGGLVGYLLWPACVLHAVMAVLFARPAYGMA